MKIGIFLTFFALSFGMASAVADGQTKRKRNTRATPSTRPAAATPTPTPVVEKAAEPAKRNERPGVGNSTIGKQAVTSDTTKYIYEFSQPQFSLRTIKIEHDADGKGSITFDRQDYEEPILDPISLTASSLTRLNELFAELDFLNSRENYQFDKDYSHLGNVAITLRKGEKERTARYNWTENKAAKELAEEYRRIANKYVWLFDINLSRENQPLESTKIMGRLESMLRRNEVADPPQMTGFLRELSNDERLPLISRNMALKMIGEIEKKAAKEGH